MQRKIEDQIIHRYELKLLLCSRWHISLLCVVKFSSLCTARFCKHCCPPEHDICFSDRNLCFATVPSLWNTSDGVSCVSHCFSCKSFLLVHDVTWNVFDGSLTAEANGRVATLACWFVSKIDLDQSAWNASCPSNCHNALSLGEAIPLGHRASRSWGGCLCCPSKLADREKQFKANYENRLV